MTLEKIVLNQGFIETASIFTGGNISNGKRIVMWKCESILAEQDW